MAGGSITSVGTWDALLASNAEFGRLVALSGGGHAG
jgi:hypothetical protein